MNQNRTYLRLGDSVAHMKYPEWGKGTVIEEKNSILSGGLCFVRIAFQDGAERLFINGLDSECCCYYFGLRVCY
ncbi:MAG: DUF3553 domain-containing protein [Nitrospirae bacterium]|nr:DUF3553 domain-containing protein [Nitrospirota bacterium]